MPTIETTVSVTVPEGATVAEIEGVVAARLRETGREVLGKAVRILEEGALAAGDVLQDRRRSVDLLSSFGWVRLERCYVRERSTGKYHYLVEVGSGQEHATAAVVEQAVALATRLPYRQAALLLGRLLGEHVDHRSLYAWVKAEGQQLVDEEAALQEAVFEDGELPPSSGEERELVVAVVDGTYIRAQREGQPSFEVRIGVAYSGRTLQSTTARHSARRNRWRARAALITLHPDRACLAAKAAGGPAPRAKIPRQPADPRRQEEEGPLGGLCHESQ